MISARQANPSAPLTAPRLKFRSSRMTSTDAAPPDAAASAVQICAGWAAVLTQKP